MMHKYSISMLIQMREWPLKLLTVAITLAGILSFAISAPAAAATAALSVSPASNDFGQTPIGVTSTAASFTVTNTGSDASGVVAVALGGINPGDFTIDSNTCVGKLAGGASCSVTVHFTPAALGARSAALKISANPGGPHAVALSGTGVSTSDLSTTAHVAAENYTNASVTITVTNLGGTASVPATMTIDADPTQNFSYEAGAGTDCTAQSVNNFGVFGSRFTCPVPGGIAPGGTYTRTLTIQNLSGQAPHYVQCDATTIMPGDANSSNNTGYATVIFG